MKFIVLAAIYFGGALVFAYRVDRWNAAYKPTTRDEIARKGNTLGWLRLLLTYIWLGGFFWFGAQIIRQYLE